MARRTAPTAGSAKDSEDEEKTLRRHGYTVLKTMGEGSYSKVRKCAVGPQAVTVAVGTSGLEGAKFVAVKTIDRRKASERFLTSFLPRELAISTRVRHTNIASTLDHFTEDPRTFVVMELAARGDLEQYISLRGPMADKGSSNDLSRSFFRQILTGVQYLHGRGIVHRDLKCENVFLDKNNVIKIGDFGFSREMRDGEVSKTFCGSRAYVAPELLQQIPYKGKPADCWSLGVIFFIILEARMPFDDRDPPKMLRRQLEKRIPFVKAKPLGRELTLALVDPRPESRISVPAALAHPWFTPHSPAPAHVTISTDHASASPSTNHRPESSSETDLRPTSSS